MVGIGEGCTKIQRTLRLDLNVGAAEVQWKSKEARDPPGFNGLGLPCVL